MIEPYHQPESELEVNNSKLPWVGGWDRNPQSWYNPAELSVKAYEELLEESETHLKDKPGLSIDSARDWFKWFYWRYLGY